ncbi:MAG TPA: hypothetical protein VF146_02970 [Bryobacteraceae bacterium]
MNPRTTVRLFEYLFVLTLVSIAGAQQFQIAAADYGSGGARANVTVRVRELSRRSAVFQVNNNTLGIDPAPGRAKSLRIRVTDARGQSKIFEYPEGSMVNSATFAAWNGPAQPVAQSGYFILKAWYGVPGQNVDVTQRLRQLAAVNATFRMGNSTFGVDPAPGVRKTLRIWARGPNGAPRPFDYPEGSIVNGAMFSSWSSGRWGDPTWNGGWEGPPRR